MNENENRIVEKVKEILHFMKAKVLVNEIVVDTLYTIAVYDDECRNFISSLVINNLVNDFNCNLNSVSYDKKDGVQVLFMYKPNGVKK